MAVLGLAQVALRISTGTDGNIPGAKMGKGSACWSTAPAGSRNAAAGLLALFHNRLPETYNTATGLQALANNINGGLNTASGIFKRCLAIQRLALTLPLALMHCLTTPTATKIRPLATGRFICNTAWPANTATGYGALS